MAYTVHTGRPNRGIGRQNSNLARLVSRKKNGGLLQEASRFVFYDTVGRRGEKNGQPNSVTTYVAQRREVMGAYHSIFKELVVATRESHPTNDTH